MDRVLQVIGGMNRAGAETMIMNVYRLLDKTKLQFDFLVYSKEKQDYEGEICAMGGRVIHISDCNLFNYTSKIDAVIRKYGPYIAVHAHTLHNSAFAMKAAKRYPSVVRMVHSHNTRNVVISSGVKRIYESITKQMIRKDAQVWLACGEEAGKYLFGEEFEKKGLVIHNGVDLTKYAERKDACDELIKRYDLDGKLVIGSVARLTEVKNHIFMLETAKYLKEHSVSFKMLFVGQGDLKGSLQKKIDELGLSNEVILTGVRSDVPELLKVFDVFFMPSLFEGNPVTLIEAQASGLPCVISDIITDKIDLGLGLIHKLSLERDSAKAWAECLIGCKNSRLNDAEAIRKAFKQHEYDAESTMLKLTALYNNGRSN